MVPGVTYRYLTPMMDQFAVWTAGNGRSDGKNCNPGVKSTEPPTEESGDPVKLLARHRAVQVAVRETQERLKGGADPIIHTDRAIRRRGRCLEICWFNCGR